MLIRPEHCHQAERSEVDGTRECFHAAQRLFPHPMQAEVAVAGGVVRYLGPGSFLNEGTGMGMDAPVSAADIATIVTFYAERGEPARVMVNALADISLGQHLASSGFVPVDIQNVLIGELADLDGALDERIRRSTDPHAWAQHTEVPELAETIASVPTVVSLELVLDGRVAAVGLCGLREPMGGMFFGGTMPWAQNRGLQLALIRHRVRLLQEAGLRCVRAAASPASVSERNFRRVGLTVAYSRVLWERK